MHTKIKIGLLEDHPAVRIGISDRLAAVPHFHVQFSDGNSAILLEFLKYRKLDVLILDLNLPDTNGFNILKVVRKKYKDLKVLIFTSYEDQITIQRTYREKANGYIHKGSPLNELMDAVETVSRGESYFPAGIEEMVVDTTTEQKKNKGLTKQETLILRLICKEKTSENISDILGISIFTVNNHRKNLIAKTQTTGMVGLMKYAYANGYFD